MLQIYDSALAKMRSRYAAGIGQRDLLKRHLAETQANLQQARQDIQTWEQVQILLGKVSDFARQQILERIEATVTAALLAVFGEGYQFKIAMRAIGAQPAAEWQVISQYGDVEVAANPEDARGGGIVDIVSLALRLAMLELLRPRVDGPLILDEPAKMVSSQYAPNLAYFLKEYAAKTGRQVIMVTHNPQLAEAADRSFLVTQADGISEVKQLS